MQLDATQIAAVRQFIAANWERTIRQPAAQSAHEIALPHPFVVPTVGPEFRLFFYWDSYFASEGLLRDGHGELARMQADNMLHLIATLGYVPNYAHVEHDGRSQPPFASPLVRASTSAAATAPGSATPTPRSQKSTPSGWRCADCPMASTIMGNMLRPRVSTTSTGGSASASRPFPTKITARKVMLAHAMAEAESGWDFTPRFAGRCADFAAIDLNSLLYLHEMNAAFFCDELGNGAGDVWRARANSRRALVDRCCWDERRGVFVDYDAAREQPSPVISIATVYPLWAGLASAAQAARVVEQLSQLELEYGLTVCAAATPRAQSYQWDYPNSWPPTQFVAMLGLERYGYHTLARRLAAKYVACVCRSFAQTGNLWEKYNALSGGVDVVGEYALPSMLGWTAGTFVYACELLAVARIHLDRVALQ
ncbi:alpha,alpha-trehalase [Candidatus Gracilibacteria bacterium]|nr:alpha,alpha-trehalase [Candidatus Gracilibacteria bacterium]